MKKIDSTQLMIAYDKVREFLHEDVVIAERFHSVETIFEDKKARTDASIMVYGVYNAGKSTLINAMLGREEAATDDIPLTYQVTAYQWGQYSILDTPGVDAPIKHENVTREQMLKADVIIFVVDPVGTAEEAKTLSVLMDLQQAGKQVFLVFNEKKNISEDDFIKLKDQTRELLQQMAAKRGLHDVLKRIPIVMINAKRALQGQLKGQPKLIELSSYPDFEKQLREFLQSISPDDIYSRLKTQLLVFLIEYVDILNNRSKSEIVRNYDELIHDINTHKTKLHQEMGHEIIRQKSRIHERSGFFMKFNPESAQTQIEKLIEDISKEISQHLNDQLQTFVDSVQNEIEELQAALPNITNDGISITAPKPENSVATPEMETINASNLNPALLKQTIDQITTLVKPEHILSSLKLVKDTLPSLMKGVGKKTMEKWAAAAATKWIPYVGTIITAASALFDLFAGDSEEKQLRQQAEEQRMARERAMQQIDDFTREISEGFYTSINNIIQDELDTFFANVVAQVNSLRQGFSDADRNNSERLERLLEIQQLAANS